LIFEVRVCEDDSMEITAQQQRENEIKAAAQGWTEAHKDESGANSSIYHPDLAVMGEQGLAQENQIINPGKVVDVAAAQDMANVANEHGMAPALAREKQLEAEAITGLTEQQREYAEIMDNRLKYNNDGKEINTHAFKEVIDQKGRKYMVLHMSPHKVNQFDKLHEYKPGALVIMTKDGPVTIQTSTDVWKIDPTATEDDVLAKINLDELGDILENPEANGLPPLGGGGSIKLAVKDGMSDQPIDHFIYRYDLSDGVGLADFKFAVKISEYKGVEIAKKAPKTIRAKDINFG